MKYFFALPLSALIVLCLLSLLVHLGMLPNGVVLLEQLKMAVGDYVYFLILLIILLESLIYVGFYFPGQFFAVIMVILAKPSLADIAKLTLVMVIAATIGSAVNFYLGRTTANEGQKTKQVKPVSLGKLLLAMLHINSLAFFMFAQGAKHQSAKIIFLAGLLNLPYYLLLIFATTVFSEDVLQLAENTLLLIFMVTLWLIIALYFDFKRLRVSTKKA